MQDWMGYVSVRERAREGPMARWKVLQVRVRVVRGQGRLRGCGWEYVWVNGRSNICPDPDLFRQFLHKLQYADHMQGYVTKYDLDRGTLGIVVACSTSSADGRDW